MNLKAVYVETKQWIEIDTDDNNESMNEWMIKKKRSNTTNATIQSRKIILLINL